ncbi:PREDICTED: protein late bloomer [Rhagoletis zephyria]|uniref:protein late bloomer n=1 Tax=Rhagoletis zephyria TaxID=28612 RepID=UPI0008117FC9|nr:PREDICTED: protein late bloomer [Rhagoletis zephyria]XP_036342178.1 protein late bloomer-like [Rhagoletis pomonella]XP_036344750.1 protein late bloomer-like [Rhagoletis pomonella]
MGCATTTVKISSILFNTLLALFAIAAIVLIAVYPGAVPDDWDTAAFIIFGLVILFAIIGCVAALRESICLTVTCAVFLLLLAILQIAVTIIILNDRQTQSGIAIVEDAWDHDKIEALQAKYECCGKDSSQDYILLNRQIPLSCYEDQTEDANKMYTEGCSAKLQRYYDSETASIATVSWVVTALEILGFLLAVFLVINFRNKQRRMQF